ncbi:hypothetical protein [Chitinophaga sp. Cy-1792]|uniref:hypothetical protein n=1 Tax=Chitinophaga sp. Cy-1792 TaxID=2608339 RepID=UPI001421212A|nr:hypothetical protein [Chitinophaga sp. Cy-1792]
MMKLKLTWSLLVALLISYNSFAQSAPKLREGKHNFTLQWISWDHPGKVAITKNTDGTYNIKGDQYSADKKDFVTIDGVIKVQTPQELLFTGSISTRYSGVNDGKVCDKKGTYHFLAKGARKYWRLQEMDNCEGNNVVDYVDIYF